MKKKFILFISLLLTLIIIAACGDNASTEGEYVIKMGTENPKEHPMTRSMEKFKELVEEKSDGRIIVGTYPNGQLGSQTEMNESTKDGRIQATYSGMSYIGGNFEPKYNIFSLPFLITRDNLSKAFELLDGEIGQELTTSLEEKGMTVLGYANLGFRNLTNSKQEVRTPDDLKGMKIRLQANPVHVSTFEALGAETVGLDFAEVYTGLQQGVIDGQENPLDIIYTNNLFEVQDYLTLTGHFFDFAAIWFNDEYFESLPTDLQEILLEAGQEAAEYHRDLYLQEENAFLDKLKESGIEVYEPTADEIKQFQDTVQPIYQEFLEESEYREFAEKVFTELGIDY